MTDRTTPELLRLDGKICIITGGSKGLGQSMALGLAESGATTILAARDVEACRGVAAEIAAKTGKPSLGIATDVTKEDQVNRLISAVLDSYGRIDVLINSAGMNIRHPIEDFPSDEFRRIIDLNLTGTWLCCRAVSAVMKKQQSGSVINIGSALSLVGLAERTAYTASKAGVVGMTKTLALEWAPFHVRCNAICPGPFLTEMNTPLLADPAKAAAVVGLTAMNRWAELHEIRGAAVFLASDASTYVTGATLSVDGGWTAK